MNDHLPPRRRAFPDSLLQQQKEYLVSEIARNIETGDGRTRERTTRPSRSRSLALRLGAVGALAVIALAAVGLSGVFGGGDGSGPLTIDKALAAVTVADGEVLHVKITGVETDGSAFAQELWSYTESATGAVWKYRGMTETSGHGLQEVAIDGAGLHQIYDAKTNSILEMRHEADADVFKQKIAGSADAYQEDIRRLLSSGQAQEDGREQIDGRDAIRIVETRPAPEGELSENVFLVDAETGEPIEWRIGNEGENRVLHFDIYEKLPGTPESLRLFDLKMIYPDAAIYTDPAAFEQAVAETQSE